MSQRKDQGQPQAASKDGPAMATRSSQEWRGVVDELRERLAELERQAEAERERKRQVALSAHTGDAAARKLLDETNRALAGMVLGIEDLQTAIAAAEGEQARAEQGEADQREAERVARLHQAGAAVQERAARVDALLEQLAAAVTETDVALANWRQHLRTWPQDDVLHRQAGNLSSRLRDLQEAPRQVGAPLARHVPSWLQLPVPEESPVPEAA